MPATQLLQDIMSTVWKIIAQRGTKVSGGCIGTTRELTEEKKVGLSDTEEIDHTMEGRPHSFTNSGCLDASWEAE